MQSATCFEIYTPEGALVFRGYLVERPFPADPGNPRQTDVGLESLREKAETVQSQIEQGKSNGDGEKMTQPQRRKLFKLLAVKGIEGNKAEDEIKRLFRVKSLEDIRKFDASKMIDHLIQEGNGHGSSF